MSRDAHPKESAKGFEGMSSFAPRISPLEQFAVRNCPILSACPEFSEPPDLKNWRISIWNAADPVRIDNAPSGPPQLCFLSQSPSSMNLLWKSKIKRGFGHTKAIERSHNCSVHNRKTANHSERVTATCSQSLPQSLAFDFSMPSLLMDLWKLDAWKFADLEKIIISSR